MACPTCRSSAEQSLRVRWFDFTVPVSLGLGVVAALGLTSLAIGVARFRKSE